jgi:hypothetical protein
MASGVPLTLDILRRSAASMKQNKDESDYDFLHRVTHVNLNDKNIGSHDLSLLNHLYSVKMVKALLFFPLLLEMRVLLNRYDGFAALPEPEYLYLTPNLYALHCAGIFI